MAMAQLQPLRCVEVPLSRLPDEPISAAEVEYSGIAEVLAGNNFICHHPEREIDLHQVVYLHLNRVYFFDGHEHDPSRHRYGRRRDIDRMAVATGKTEYLSRGDQRQKATPMGIAECAVDNAHRFHLIVIVVLQHANHLGYRFVDHAHERDTFDEVVELFLDPMFRQ